MKTAPATIAIALAFAALPTASIAEPAPKAGIGVAFIANNGDMKVAEVWPGGTGDLMGVRAGDVVTHARGKRINSTTKMTAYVSSLKVGDPIELTIKRKGESLQLKGTAMARKW